MRSRSVIVIEIGSESSSQRGFMEHDHMIEAFATNGSVHPLDIGSLPRRARCRQDFANAHVSHVFSEVIAKDRIAVAQEVAQLVQSICEIRSFLDPRFAPASV